ncbi:hypothetical protein EBB07_03590 [Paenibacillaceae bacterium]|nr:hypothetical protein EBB07_03590 [Paenibacillaceae bacterium]
MCLTVDHWISLIGIVITALFSWFLWRVGDKSARAAEKSAEVAKVSQDMQQRQEQKEEEERAFLSKLYLERVRKEANYIQAAVQGQYTELNPHTLQNARGLFQLTEYELGKYLPNKVEVIKKIWRVFDEHYSLLWFDKEKNEFSTKIYNENPSSTKAHCFQAGNQIENLVKQL